MQQSRRVLDIRPDRVYARHSEGDFVRRADGSILFVYTRFFEKNDDEAPSAFVAIESADEGETWSQPREVVSAAPFSVKNVMSVSLMRLQSGEIGLFYIVKEAWYTRIMLARSDDEGRTFGRHAECTLPDRRGWFVLNNSRVERLHTGRILVPLAYHRTGLDERTGKFFFDPCACACMLYSDDDGATWSEAPDVIHPPFSGTRSGLQEPGVLELRDGALWAYFRTDKMYQYEAFSRDGGLHWSTPQASRFTSPLSPMKLLRQPDTGHLFAFWNPVPNHMEKSQHCEGVWTGGRTPLVYATSDDDGITWSPMRPIEDDPRHGYCYPAAFFTRDGAMLVAYCAGGVEDGSCLARLTIQKIPLEKE